MITPYKQQLEAVEAAIKHDQGIICMPTGSGKTVVMALLINRLQVKTLIIVPTLELQHQLTSCFLQYFGDLTNITIKNIDSTDLYKHTDYGCLIIDEAHRSAASTYRKLSKKAWNGVYFRFHFTATPFRSRNEENILLESIAGQVIYKLSYQEAVKSNIIVPIEAYYVEFESSSETMYGNYASIYKQSVVQSQEHNRLVSDLLGKFHANSLSTLCIIKEIEHGERLSDISGAAFANGQSHESRDLIKWFSEGKLTSLIGTHGVVGEGVDTRACEYVLLPIPVKSRNLFMQIIGRAVRKYHGKESAKIILFKNSDHKWFKAAFKEQCKILKEEFGIVPVRLEI